MPTNPREDRGGILPTQQGGTGIHQAAPGAILYCFAPNKWRVLPPGQDGDRLEMVAGFPAWVTPTP